MLDKDLKEQLQGVFAELKPSIELAVDASDHNQQAELLDFLRDLASTSPKISVKVGAEKSPVPRFRILRDGSSTGISFRGIPGGHEFTSLVLAILNSAGQGKLPDSGLTNRIRSLPDGTHIRTYISLSCENCPDVVQALNQIALAHGNLSHEMVDGGMVPEELEKLKIQGVPSVVVGNELIHSGRSNLAELLTKLESKLGTQKKSVKPVNLGHYDVAVIGAGPAGASAAIYSARKGLKTIVIAEKIGGQVQETKDIENLISVVKTEGPILAAALDKHMAAYNIQVLEHRRVEEVNTGKKRELIFNSGERLTTDTLIVASGAKWRELNIPGEKEYIGRGVAFCPHCDGPYYKGKKVAVVGGGNSGVEAAIDLAGICSSVVLYEFLDKLKADQVLIDKLKSLPNVKIVMEARTTEVVGNGEKVVGLRYEDRQTKKEHEEKLDGIFVQIGLSPNSGFIKDIVTVNRFGEIIVDEKGRTSMPGIYAAGDVTTVPYKQIVIAMGEGAKVALAAFEDRMRGEI
ncbi:MAG TPA: alkyl hydroperoxide reductase subunit F [Oligoflexus sp.]|uniref:alkyl hydroperoxide reductase subunit F n=1 Tax=Oligoflexus sp. TaxID=1971216 RepID=UPI002D811722|nr:alkyl hydroperoxide reductase subunit F [Oligoflexus sp.]HET9236382.1 alkyl hydroperoxide reductase subunit F [Oligoflexus sp.]